MEEPDPDQNGPSPEEVQNAVNFFVKGKIKSILTINVYFNTLILHLSLITSFFDVKNQVYH